MTYDEFKQKHSGAMPKARKPMAHPEDDIQKECVRWFKEEAYPELAPLLFHPNNEPYFGAGKTPDQKARAGARAKSMGVTPGVADLILLYPSAVNKYARYDEIQESQPIHALCIEMKSRTGAQSDSQREWQRIVTQNGYSYVVCRSVEQFKRIIRDYIGIPPREPEQAAIDRLFGEKFKAKVHKTNKK